MNSEIIQILEDNGIKATPMRMLVLKQMMLQDRNLSLTDIEYLLSPSDRITIYRTLQTFVKNGIAHCINANNSSVYALCTTGCNAHLHSDQHPHFICENCKKITCNSHFLYTLSQKPETPNYVVHKIEMTIKGICPDCSHR